MTEALRVLGGPPGSGPGGLGDGPGACAEGQRPAVLGVACHSGRPGSAVRGSCVLGESSDPRPPGWLAGFGLRHGAWGLGH